MCFALLRQRTYLLGVLNCCAPHNLLSLLQSRVQQINTDFTHVTGMSLYTHQVNRATALTVNLKGRQ